MAQIDQSENTGMEDMSDWAFVELLLWMLANTYLCGLYVWLNCLWSVCLDSPGVWMQPHPPSGASKESNKILCVCVGGEHQQERFCVQFFSVVYYIYQEFHLRWIATIVSFPWSLFCPPTASRKPATSVTSLPVIRQSTAKMTCPTVSGGYMVRNVI